MGWWQSGWLATLGKGLLGQLQQPLSLCTASDSTPLCASGAPCSITEIVLLSQMQGCAPTLCGRMLKPQLLQEAFQGAMSLQQECWDTPLAAGCANIAGISNGKGHCT